VPINSVTFTLRPNLASRQRRGALKRAASLPGVTGIDPLSTESPSEPLQRIYFALLAADADPSSVLEGLRSLPEVEAAGNMVPRKLA
jgi:hypothetical protein